jgi:transcriptional regulator with XRE-family HTH domain
MANKIATLLPATNELMQQFGERLRLARLRRGLSAKQVCERAGMVPMTLRSLERGSSGVTIGAYLVVMQVLGIEQDLKLLGQIDVVGRSLQDSRLPALRVASVHSRKEGRKVALQASDKVLRLAAGGDKADELRKALGPDYAEMARLAADGNAADELHKVQDDRVVNKMHTDWENNGEFISSSVLSKLITSHKKEK